MDITPELLEYIIKRWTDTEINDPAADRDSLEAIVAMVCTDGNLAAASSKINHWRKSKIEAAEQ